MRESLVSILDLLEQLTEIKMSSDEEGEEEKKIEIPPKKCTPEIIKSGLSRIGKTYDGNSHAFINLKL